MESLSQCPWRTTSTWCSLLGHLCPSSNMANSEGFLDPVPDTGMAKPPTRFCHGVPTSAHRNAAVHVFATRIQMLQNDKENACTQVDM